MAITRRGRPTHLVSQNKHIRLWHRQLAYVSNARIVRVSKLVDGISLDQDDREYNLAEVFVDSDDSNASDYSDQEESPIQLSAKNVAEVTSRATV